MFDVGGGGMLLQLVKQFLLINSIIFEIYNFLKTRSRTPCSMFDNFIFILFLKIACNFGAINIWGLYFFLSSFKVCFMYNQLLQSIYKKIK